MGISPQLSDVELVTVTVLQALLGFTSERRFIRYAHTHVKAWFPYLPQRPGYNKRQPLRTIHGLRAPAPKPTNARPPST